MVYYHATSEDNALKILKDGFLKPGIDHIVYLADSFENALKFVFFRDLKKVIVFELEVPDESKIMETFDHSFNFFQCKSWGYPEKIGIGCVKETWEQDMTVFK